MTCFGTIHNYICIFITKYIKWLSQWTWKWWTFIDNLYQIVGMTTFILSYAQVSRLIFGYFVRQHSCHISIHFITGLFMQGIQLMVLHLWLIQCCGSPWYRVIWLQLYMGMGGTSNAPQLFLHKPKEIHYRTDMIMMMAQPKLYHFLMAYYKTVSFPLLTHWSYCCSGTDNQSKFDFNLYTELNFP